MNPARIRKKADSIKRRLKEHDAKRKIIEGELAALQYACPHENARTWHDSGWGRMSSTEWHCDDCDLHRST